jgi:hypothetical protein
VGAERRLADAAGARRLAEVPVLGDRDDMARLVQGHHWRRARRPVQALRQPRQVRQATGSSASTESPASGQTISGCTKLLTWSG